MGVYSWVDYQCKCGHNLEFQTKCGPKEYGSYPIDAVPIEVAQELVKNLVQCKCGKTYRLIPARRPIDVIPMEAMEI